MASQTTLQKTLIKANNLEEALKGDICPYSGEQIDPDNPSPEIKRNQEIDETTDRTTKWAHHQICGRVMILHRSNGLCIIESECGRYCVPIASLTFGALNTVIDFIDNKELASEELEQLINMLRVKAKSHLKLPKYPRLWIGCVVEIQMGKAIRQATIIGEKGNLYQAKTLIDGITVNISNKDILRIV